jgi:hypothetical protein
LDQTGFAIFIQLFNHNSFVKPKFKNIQIFAISSREKPYYPTFLLTLVITWAKNMFQQSDAGL